MGSNDCTVIRGGRVLDVQTGAAPHQDVLVCEDKIAALSPPGEVFSGQTASIDAGGKLLIPGLINAHTHGHGALGKGRGDRWTLELLLNAGPWISGEREMEDKKLAAQLNAAEMLLKGCTACYDLYFEFPEPTPEGMTAVAEGYGDVGVRAVIAPMLADLSLYEAVPGFLDYLPEKLRGQAAALRLAPCEKSLKASRLLLETWQPHPNQARLAIAPTIPHHCSDAFLAGCRDLAREYDAGIHMHLAESKLQGVIGRQRYGKTAAAHLDDLGILGPHFTAAHCVWLERDDLQLLADRGCSIAHQPECNLRLGSGIAPARDFLERGINTGIGTDGCNASDHQNMFSALRAAANVSRVVERDYQRWLSAREAFDMATEGGARVLGFGGLLGRIAPGRLADIVFLDLHSVNYLPLNNPLHQVVNCEDSSAVDSVMVGGRMRLRERRFVDFDYHGLRRRIAPAMERLNRATAARRELAERLEPLLGRYCIGLSGRPRDPRELRTDD